MNQKPATLAAVLLALVAAWAPLPFASVEPGARLILAIGILTALVLTLLDPPPARSLAPVLPGATALAVVGLWGIVQAAPLPGPVVRALSQPAAEWQEVAARLASQTSDDARLHLSLAPDQSLQVGLWLLTLAGLALAAATVGRRRRYRRWLLLTCASAGLFQALYGARRWAARSSEIWGVEVPGSGARLRGTFVNSDHLAFYLALVLAMTTAWLARSLSHQRTIHGLDRKIGSVAPPALTWLTLFCCLAFTGSRAALVAALLATGVQGALISLSQRRRRWLPAGIALGALGLITVSLIGLQAGLGRWLATSSYELTWNIRLEVYAATWDLSQSFPWVGVGLGAFANTFPMVQPAEVPGRWTHTHNDWLELLLSAGWPVAILFASLLSWFTIGLIRRLGESQRSEDRAALVAAIGALTYAALHSWLDFGLAMPANATTLVLLCGCAAARPQAERRNQVQRRRQPEAVDSTHER